MTPLKLIILDRDGTINEDRDDYVKSPDEWVPIPGALEAIARVQVADVLVDRAVAIEKHSRLHSRASMFA